MKSIPKSNNMVTSSCSMLASQSLFLTLTPNPPLLPPTTTLPYPPTLPRKPIKRLSISSSQTITPSPRLSLSGSTRSLTSLASIALTASKIITHNIINNNSFNFQRVLVTSAGPAFFAAVKNQTVGPLNTPLTLVAAGLAKWLDIYSGVLMVRVLLSWFPNIPWEKQPLSAIRDLCDPYLNLFRNIIPPIFDTLDVSPLLAFAVLGTLGSILNSTRASY